MLVFRGQRLSDDDLLAFSRHFGALDPPPNQGAGRKSPPGYPDIYVVSNVRDAQGEPIGALGDGEAAWHTDMSYAPLPPDASMLYSLEIPPAGGDTCFAGMKAALAKMPPALAARVATLDIKHDGTYDSGGTLRKGLTATDDPRSSPGTPHPALIEHPESGARALYLGRRRNAWVVGLPLEESERLLDELWSLRRDLGLPPQVGGRRSRAVGQPHAPCTGATPSTPPRAASCTAPRSRARARRGAPRSRRRPTGPQGPKQGETSSAGRRLARAPARPPWPSRRSYSRLTTE